MQNLVVIHLSAPLKDFNWSSAKKIIKMWWWNISENVLIGLENDELSDLRYDS